MTERRLNATAASLLGFLHDRPMSGYELAATAAAVIGDFWTLTQSQVYRELASMADDGLVMAGERGTRDRRPFAITDAGREAAERRQASPGGCQQVERRVMDRLGVEREEERPRGAVGGSAPGAHRSGG